MPTADPLEESQFAIEATGPAAWMVAAKQPVKANKVKLSAAATVGDAAFVLLLVSKNNFGIEAGASEVTTVHLGRPLNGCTGCAADPKGAAGMDVTPGVYFKRKVQARQARL